VSCLLFLHAGKRIDNGREFSPHPTLDRSSDSGKVDAKARGPCARGNLNLKELDEVTVKCGVKGTDWATISCKEVLQKFTVVVIKILHLLKSIVGCRRTKDKRPSTPDQGVRV